MILDFEHVKQKQHDDGTHWATYSDLFVSLSFLFLLLYVVASLRTSASISLSAIEAKEAKERAEHLENQLAMMQQSAVGYLEDRANERERKAYEQVMDKLKLLQDDQKSKQDELSREIAAHKQKENELNRYQETIKNLMLANLNAKKELKEREEKIASTSKERYQIESKLKNTELALQKNDEKLQATLNHLETSVAKVEETKVQAKQVESTYQQKLAAVNTSAQQKIEEAKTTAQRTVEEAKTRAQRTLEEVNLANQKKLAELTTATQKQLEQMTAQNQKQISQLQTQLTAQQSELKQKSDALAQATAESQKRGDEIAKLQGQFQAEKTRTEKLMGELHGQHEANLASAKAEFEGKLGKFASDAEARLNAEREYRGRVEAENASFGKGLSDLKGALAGSEGKLAALARERGDLESKNKGLRDALGQAQAQAQGLAQALADNKQKEALIADQLAKTVEDAKRKELAANDKAAKAMADAADKAARALAEAKAKEAAANDKVAKTVADAKEKEAALGAELAKAKANLARRGNISNKLADAFRNSGINAQVDKKTGDLILNFGDEYFDTGRYFLKTGMINVLNKAFPLYAKTLFEDPENAAHISAVEIIGFASPTYQDRVVNPNSLSAVNQSAINYNLDLSYKRARSIFGHVFNPEKLAFAQQKAMLPLVKVTGRSFFTQDIEGVNADKLDIEKFCKAYDCQKSQNVVVRFTLID